MEGRRENESGCMERGGGYSGIYSVPSVFVKYLVRYCHRLFQRREPKSVWAWLMLLYFIPVVGFVFYLLLGEDMHKRKMFRIKEMEDHLNEAIRRQEHRLKTKRPEKSDPDIAGYTDLIMYNLETSDAVLSDDNEVTYFLDGNEKFEALIRDLEQAKYFTTCNIILSKDVLFNRTGRCW